MLASMVLFLGSGRYISKSGHYRVFPIVVPTETAEPTAESITY